MKWLNKILGIGALALASLTFSPKKTEACSSAKPMGRGMTNVAIADDASAAYWNPAGLVQLERPELDLTIGTSRYKRFLCYGQPLSKNNAIGLNLAYRNIENFDNGDDFKTFWLKLGYARKLGKLSIGVNLTLSRNYDEDGLITYTHDGKTFQDYLNRDLGFLYKLNDKIKFGLLLQGYGYNHSEILRSGASLKLDEKTLLAAEVYDATGKTDGKHLRLGLERKINDSWSVRGGIRIFGDGEDEEDNDKPFDGILRGSCGISYKKGNLETSIAYFGKKRVNITINKKF